MRGWGRRGQGDGSKAAPSFQSIQPQGQQPPDGISFSLPCPLLSLSYLLFFQGEPVLPRQILCVLKSQDSFSRNLCTLFAFYSPTHRYRNKEVLLFVLQQLCHTWHKVELPVWCGEGAHKSSVCIVCLCFFLVVSLEEVCGVPGEGE